MKTKSRLIGAGSRLETTTRHDNQAAPAPGRAHSLQEPRRVFTVAEAADVLGISKSLAYELIAQNKLPAVRLGRRIIVPANAIDALLATATQAISS